MVPPYLVFWYDCRQDGGEGLGESIQPPRPNALTEQFAGCLAETYSFALREAGYDRAVSIRHGEIDGSI